MDTRGNWEKFELYILSLWLLFFLMIVVTIDLPICLGDQCRFIGWRELLQRNVVPLIALIFVLLGAVFYLRFDYKISGSKSLPVKVDSIEDMNYEHLTFLTTYIIPLICFNLTSERYLIALALLLVVIGVIYVRTDKFYANPTLAVLGFRIYLTNLSTRTGVKEKIVLITKSRIALGDSVRYQQLDDKVYFARKS